MKFEDRIKTVIGEQFLQWMKGSGYVGLDGGAISFVKPDAWDTVVIFRLWELFNIDNQKRERLETFRQAVLINAGEMAREDPHIRDAMIAALRALPIEQKEGIIAQLRVITPQPQASEGPTPLVVIPGGAGKSPIQ